MGIGACGHQAMEQGIFLRVIASCEPNQKAIVENFVVKEGIRFDDHYKTLFFYLSKKLTNFQTTYTCDFTKVKCLQWEGPTAPCRLPDIPSRCSWKWVDIVAVDYNDRPVSRLHVMYDKNNGTDVWHYILFYKELDMLDTRASGTESNESDSSQYGYIIKSGWGNNPPRNVNAGIIMNSPTYV